MSQDLDWGWERVPITSVPQDLSYPFFILPEKKKIHYPESIVVLVAGESTALVLCKPPQYNAFFTAFQRNKADTLGRVNSGEFNKHCLTFYANRVSSIGAERMGYVDLYAEDDDGNTWKLEGSQESHSTVGEMFRPECKWLDILKDAGAQCTGPTIGQEHSV